jgi:hypothetical protein
VRTLHRHSPAVIHLQLQNSAPCGARAGGACSQVLRRSDGLAAGVARPRRARVDATRRDDGFSHL